MMIRLVQLMLLLGFYAAYFRKQLALKKQGIDTNRLGKGSKPARTARIETALYLSTVITAAVQFLSVPFSRWLLPVGLPVWLNIVGLGASAGGVLFFLLATTTMGRSWRAGVDRTQDTAMVTDGVYQFSRNPAFVGFDLLYIGSFLATPNCLLLLLAIFSIGLLHLQIREEEAYLPEVFGEDYMKYKQRVPRYLLIVGRGADKK